MLESIPPGWRSVLAKTLADPKMLGLEEFVADQRAKYDVYPAAEDVFTALRLTPYASVRAVIIGQDPYHGPGQAHGLAFSVPPSMSPPQSLRNILTELGGDLERPMTAGGSLVPWALRGVLLLNTVLTVRGGEPGSHANLGWEGLTGAIIQAVNAKPGPIVFLLWGARARAQRRSIDGLRHVVIESAHPSPLSARRGFVGSAPFRRANEELAAADSPRSTGILAQTSGWVSTPADVRRAAAAEGSRARATWCQRTKGAIAHAHHAPRAVHCAA